MIKKLFTFGLLLSLLTISGTTKAQGLEYPRYGFWSNWSIGASVDVVKQGYHGMKWGKGISWGASILAEKELNHVWDFRATIQLPGLYNAGYELKGKQKPSQFFDRYANAMVGVKFSIIDAIKGYDTTRRSSIYLVAMTGAAYRRSDVDRFTKGRLNLTLVAEGGLGYSYQICKHGTIFVEGLVDDHYSIRNVFTNRKYMDFMLNLGYMYNFGPTAADVARLAELRCVSQADYDAVSSQVGELQNKIDNQNKQIKKLEARVVELENELANVKPDNSAAADSLQRLIDQVKADQMTFYALPFSILFDVDRYTVNDKEMQKLAAVARIMKDNPDTKYNLYGFCDYTGSDKYNQALSEKRVNEVKRLLVNKYGIAADRLSTEGKGKSVWFGDVKFSVNRRVSFYRVIE